MDRQKMTFNVAKCNLGKVQLESMRSAICFVTVHVLRGVPWNFYCLICIVQYILHRIVFKLLVAEPLPCC